MATQSVYTTVDQLDQLTGTSTQNSDLLLVTSGDKSYKLRIDDLKNFMNVQFVLEDWMFENKTITSISNTIHATALHFEAIATVDILKGQIVTMVPYAHDEAAGDSPLPLVGLADNRFGPALGVAKQDMLAGESGAIMSGGIFTYDGYDLSAFNNGQTLWLGQDGNFTNIKPESLVTHQACGFVLHNGEGDSSVMLAFQSVEPQGHDVALAGFEYGLQATNVEAAIAEMFSKCNQELVTINKALISNNKVTLTNVIDGDLVFDSVRIFSAANGNAYDQYSAAVGQFYNTVEFDSADNLNGKYATFTYMSAKPWTHESPWL
jgi:hypothetical protein